MTDDVCMIESADAPHGKCYAVNIGTAESPAIVHTCIYYDELIESGEMDVVPKLDRYDSMVCDAIGTNYLAGHRFITVNMIYRTMTGRTYRYAAVSEEWFDRIMDSVEKLKGRMYIKFNGEYNGKQIDVRYDEPLVDYELEHKKISGETVLGIRVLSEPVLLKWPRLIGELDEYDVTLRNVPGVIHTVGNMMLIGYLLDRVRASADTIDMADMYKAIGNPKLNAAQRRNIRDKVGKCLCYWTERGLITGYEHTPDGVMIQREVQQ